MDLLLQLVPGMVTDMEVNAVVIYFQYSEFGNFSETGDSPRNNGVHQLNMLMSTVQTSALQTLSKKS